MFSATVSMKRLAERREFVLEDLVLGDQGVDGGLLLEDLLVEVLALAEADVGLLLGGLGLEFGLGAMEFFAAEGLLGLALGLLGHGELGAEVPADAFEVDLDGRGLVGVVVDLGAQAGQRLLGLLDLFLGDVEAFGPLDVVLGDQGRRGTSSPAAPAR